MTNLHNTEVTALRDQLFEAQASANSFSTELDRVNYELLQTRQIVAQQVDEEAVKIRILKKREQQR